MRQYPGAADAPARGGFDLSTRERSEPVGVCSRGKFSRVPRTDFTGLERGRRRTRQEQISHSALRLQASRPKLPNRRAFLVPWLAEGS